MTMLDENALEHELQIGESGNWTLITRVSGNRCTAQVRYDDLCLIVATYEGRVEFTQGQPYPVDDLMCQCPICLDQNENNPKETLEYVMEDILRHFSAEARSEVTAEDFAEGLLWSLDYLLADRKEAIAEAAISRPMKIFASPSGARVTTRLDADSPVVVFSTNTVSQAEHLIAFACERSNVQGEGYLAPSLEHWQRCWEIIRQRED